MPRRHRHVLVLLEAKFCVCEDYTDHRCPGEALEAALMRLRRERDEARAQLARLVFSHAQGLGRC